MATASSPVSNTTCSRTIRLAAAGDMDEGSGAGRFYEVGNIANVVAAGHAESIGYILKLGVGQHSRLQSAADGEAVEGDCETRLSDADSTG